MTLRVSKCTRRVLMPKYSMVAAPRYWPSGKLLFTTSGRLLNTKPMATEMTVMMPKAATEPAAENDCKKTPLQYHPNGVQETLQLLEMGRRLAAQCCSADAWQKSSRVNYAAA